MSDKVVVDESGEVPVERRMRTITFSPTMRVKRKMFALRQDHDYITSNGVYVNCTGSSLSTQYVVHCNDFLGNLVGTLDHLFVTIPTNIDDDADKRYYESILKDGQSIDDVPHRKISDYVWSYAMRFGLSNSPLKLVGDGLDWPVSLDILPPGKLSDGDGDVFNRVYEVQTKVYANHMDMPATAIEGMKVWIDKASMAAFIEAIPNKTDWKKLIYSGTGYDEAVPSRMRDGIEKLISKTVFLDDTYFKLTLTQLQTFLGMIRDELWAGLDAQSRDEIARMCDFKYSLSDVTFKNHSRRNDDWDSATLGLFGYRTGAAGTKYSECLDNFNNHLQDEFKSDWRKLVVTVSDSQYVDGEPNPEYIGTRDYHYILKEAYSTVAAIEDKRDRTLSILYGEVNMPVA